MNANPLEVETRRALARIIELGESPDADVLERIRANLSRRLLNIVAIREAEGAQTMPEEEQPIQVPEPRAIEIVRELVRGLSEGRIIVSAEPRFLPGPGQRGRFIMATFFERPEGETGAPQLPAQTWDAAANARAAAELGDRATYTPSDLEDLAAGPPHEHEPGEFHVHRYSGPHTHLDEG